MRSPRWRGVVLAVAGVVTAVSVTATISAWEPEVVWVRWDGSVEAASNWISSSVVVGADGGVVILRAGDVRIGRTPVAGRGSGASHAAVGTGMFRRVFPASEVTVCTGVPDGPPLTSGTLSGIGFDGRSICLDEDAWWRRTLRGLLPGLAQGRQTVRYVETRRRTVGGADWRAFEAVPAETQATRRAGFGSGL